jgi:hypothetical protein
MVSGSLSEAITKTYDTWMNAQTARTWSVPNRKEIKGKRVKYKLVGED